MEDKDLNEWKCEKPVLKNVEEECLPNTRRQLIPGYDFNTATNIGLQQILPSRDYFEVKQLFDNKTKEVKDYSFIKRHYTTSSQGHYGPRAAYDPISQANKISGTNCKFIKEFEEFVRKREVEKIPTYQSRYREDYKIYPADPEIRGKVVDLSPDFYCKIKGIAKDVQPVVYLTSPTVAAELDCYLTTTKADYPYISQERKDFFKAPKEKFAAKKEKNASRIFEEGLFRFRHLNRTLPQHFDRVPNSGITTESCREFKNRWGEEYIKPEPVYYNAVQLRVTKGDALKIPAMYQTEYSHYGSHKSPNQIV